MDTRHTDSRTVLSLVDLDGAGDPSRYGHKAATLAALRREGLPVPDGFVLPVGTTASPADLEAALERLGNEPVAVRSSGVAEDLPDASWAGQYDTFLNVRGVEAVRSAIDRCLASAHSDRAAAYGVAAGVAVLVQRMVYPDAAGVAFSANPVTGARDEVVVSAVRGLGDKLVGGESIGEEWVVRDGSTRAVQPAGVLSEADALRVAELARRIEALRGAPQDVEWALASGDLLMLQARPITALPVRPEVSPPAKGIWTKDTSHFAGPVTPFGGAVIEVLYDDAIREMCDSWGLMLEVVENRVIGHEVYSHAIPFGGGSETASPPPWWALAIAVRLVPSIRRRLAVGARAIESGLLLSIPRDWESRDRDALVRELEALIAIDVSAMDDSVLWRHLDDLMALCGRTQRLHFRLFIPYAVALYDLCVATRELLGWDEARMMRLLQGLSVASSAPARALHRLAASLRSSTAVRNALDDPDWLERLPEIDPQAAARVRAYLAEWGLRTLDYDPGSRSLAERPDVLTTLLSDAVRAQDRHQDFTARRQAAIAEARSALAGPQRARFDTLLETAELVYPQREDNVMLTDNVPLGLLRRAVLEIGRRLAVAGKLRNAVDATMLSLDELRSGRESLALVARRKAELAWVRANPGPLRYGPEPGPPPDIRGLPPAPRRLMATMLWMMGLELSAKPASEGELQGQPVSAGSYRGRVRVVRNVDELHALRRGEVLVCPVTAPAWSVVFAQAGALVTDGGSVLSHAAIIAREHGVPGVVATGNATMRLRTGMDVTVDGTTGRVIVHSNG